MRRAAMMGLVKICGVTRPEDADAAARAGADMIGFVFAPRSPRLVTPETAAEIALETRQRADDRGEPCPQFCGVFVDAGDRLLAETAPFRASYQFHGRESPARVEAMRREFGRDVLKAVGVGAGSDLAGLDEFAAAADMLLFDAKAGGAGREGGQGAVFDWALLSHYRAATPFLLAGGLGPANVASAIAAAAASPAFAGVDVSSGVEDAPGRKATRQIEAFVSAARSAFATAPQRRE
jgi:phosphoribosylanthranilate isomerase